MPDAAALFLVPWCAALKRVGLEEKAVYVACPFCAAFFVDPSTIEDSGATMVAVLLHTAQCTTTATNDKAVRIIAAAFAENATPNGAETFPLVATHDGASAALTAAEAVARASCLPRVVFGRGGDVAAAIVDTNCGSLTLVLADERASNLVLAFGPQRDGALARVLEGAGHVRFWPTGTPCTSPGCAICTTRKQRRHWSCEMGSHGAMGSHGVCALSSLATGWTDDKTDRVTQHFARHARATSAGTAGVAGAGSARAAATHFVASGSAAAAASLARRGAVRTRALPAATGMQIVVTAETLPSLLDPRLRAAAALGGVPSADIAALSHVSIAALGPGLARLPLPLEAHPRYASGRVPLRPFAIGEGDVLDVDLGNGAVGYAVIDPCEPIVEDPDRPRVFFASVRYLRPCGGHVKVGSVQIPTFEIMHPTTPPPRVSFSDDPDAVVNVITWSPRLEYVVGRGSEPSGYVLHAPQSVPPPERGTRARDCGDPFARIIAQQAALTGRVRLARLVHAAIVADRPSDAAAHARDLTLFVCCPTTTIEIVDSSGAPALPFQCEKAAAASPTCSFRRFGFRHSTAMGDKGAVGVAIAQYYCNVHRCRVPAVRSRAMDGSGTIAQPRLRAGCYVTGGFFATCGSLVTPSAVDFLWSSFTTTLSVNAAAAAATRASLTSLRDAARVVIELVKDVAGPPPHAALSPAAEALLGGPAPIESADDKSDTDSDDGASVGSIGSASVADEDEGPDDDASVCGLDDLHGVRAAARAPLDAPAAAAAWFAVTALLTMLTDVVTRRAPSIKKVAAIIAAVHEYEVEHALEEYYFPYLWQHFASILRVDGVFWMADMARYHSGRRLKKLGNVFMNVVGTSGTSGVALTLPVLEAGETRSSLARSIGRIAAAAVGGGGLRALTAVVGTDNPRATQNAVNDVCARALPGLRLPLASPLVLVCADIWHRVQLLMKAAAKLDHSDEHLFVSMMFSTMLAVHGVVPSASTAAAGAEMRDEGIAAAPSDTDKMDAAFIVLAMRDASAGVPHVVRTRVCARLALSGVAFARDAAWRAVPGLARGFSVPPEAAIALAASVGLVNVGGCFRNVSWSAGAVGLLPPSTVLGDATALFAVPGVEDAAQLRERLVSTRLFFSRSWRSESFNPAALGQLAARALVAQRAAAAARAAPRKAGGGGGRLRMPPARASARLLKLGVLHAAAVDVTEARQGRVDLLAALAGAAVGAETGITRDEGVADACRLAEEEDMCEYVVNNRVAGGHGDTSLVESIHASFAARLNKGAARHSSVQLLKAKQSVIVVEHNQSRFSATSRAAGTATANDALAAQRGAGVRSAAAAHTAGLALLTSGCEGHTRLVNRAAPPPMTDAETSDFMDGLLPYSNAARPLHESQMALVDDTLVSYASKGHSLIGTFRTVEEYILKVVFHEHRVAEIGGATTAQIRYYMASVKARAPPTSEGARGGERR